MFLLHLDLCRVKIDVFNSKLWIIIFQVDLGVLLSLNWIKIELFSGVFLSIVIEYFG